MASIGEYLVEDVRNEEDEREFDFLIERAGIVIPPGRRAGMSSGFAEVRAQVKRIWELRTEAEPMTIFKLKPISTSKK
jgi:hypothetical protein